MNIDNFPFANVEKLTRRLGHTSFRVVKNYIYGYIVFSFTYKNTYGLYCCNK